MNKIIQALTELANSAALTTEQNITAFLDDADITEQQKKAIEAKDLDTLTETIHDLPIIKCIPIIPAEDDEDSEEEKQDNTEASNDLAIAVNG